MHSPYSYDACDKKGWVDGKLNKECLQNLKLGLCEDRIDYVFLTDHPSHMQEFEMEDLLLSDLNDQIILKNGAPYANRIGSCSNSFTPTVLVGFEGKILAMGMTKHLDPDSQVRTSLYGQDSADLRNRLSTETEALVFVPHTESKTLEWIHALQPDGIEIYNFHANIDPKIRKSDLKLPPFLNIPALLTYLIDPYEQLNPDFAFLNFLETSPLYSEKWNSLIDSGLKVVGVGGTDSHENAFPQQVADDERFDSHRRIMRMMSNHVLVATSEPDEVKSAIKAGHSWVVFEGLGTPANMDFYANIGASTVGVGDTASLNGEYVTLVVQLPTLHIQSPHGDNKPTIRLKLKKVLSDGKDEVVAHTEGEDIRFSTSEPGAYRAEITIIPSHLREFLGTFVDQADQEYRWITTNHIYLNP